MRFHKEKMQEINFAMRGLWGEVYRGSDIEYIQIRSDVDDSLVGAAANQEQDFQTIEVDPHAKTKRGAGSSSYNYRLVMVGHLGWVAG